MTDLFEPKAARAKPVTTADVNRALRKHYAAPRYACLLEVRSATGATTVRSADAIVMGLWPSMGMELEGFEVKVSRSDWQRERADPAKAEKIAQYCDRWWLLTGPGVVHDESEVPPGWGWMVYDGKRFKTMRKAPKLEAKPPPRPFLASLLRNVDVTDAARLDAAVADKVEAKRKELEARFESRISERTREAEALAKNVKDFEEASGLSLSATNWRGELVSNYEGKTLGEAVKLLKAIGLEDFYHGVPLLIRSLRRSAERIEEALGGTVGAVDSVSGD